MIGVYKIVNIVDNKIYVGSSNNIERRTLEHFASLRRNKHCNHYLQFAFNKHGKEVFEFHILEECSLENIIEREQYWIDSLQSTDSLIGYNLAKLAYKAADQIKPKIPVAQIDLKQNKVIERFKSITEANDRMGVATGRTDIGDCLRETMRRVSAFGFKWVECSDQDTDDELIERAKLSLYFGNPLEQIDLKTGEVIVVHSRIAEALLSLGKSVESNNHIRSCCKGKIEQAYGYKWRFINKQKYDKDISD